MNDFVSPNIQINTGISTHVHPSIDNCLKSNNGQFDTTANAVRLYEWLGTTEITPPILESGSADKDGLVAHHPLGNRHYFAIYPREFTSLDHLKMEQLLQATDDMRELMYERISMAHEHRESPQILESLQETKEKINGKLSLIVYYNACAILNQDRIHKRFLFEDIEVLDCLCAMIKVQRYRKPFLDWYGSYPETTSKYPNELYDKLELANIYHHLLRDQWHSYYDSPARIQAVHGLLSDSFVKQCCMAISTVTGFDLPIPHYEKEIDQVYFWARQVLMEMKDEVPKMLVKPKLTNVISIKK